MTNKEIDNKIKLLDEDIKSCLETMSSGRYPSIERSYREFRIQKLELLVEKLLNEQATRTPRK